jgi:DNA-binding GntR family transcriptional regulator
VRRRAARRPGPPFSAPRREEGVRRICAEKGGSPGGDLAQSQADTMTKRPPATRPSAAPPRPARAARPAASPAAAASEAAYRQLQELIISGRLAPGAPLIETDLSLRLHVSRTPVRAALQRLQQEGFVMGSKVGHMMRSVVAPLTADDMRELFTMIGALEGIVARRAAEFDPAKRLKIVHELTRLNKEMNRAATARPPQVAYAQDLHERFHQVMVDVAAGPRLRSMIEALQPQVERYGRAYTGASIPHFDESLAEHEAIIAAVKAGDVDAAEQTTTVNWRNGADRYRRTVELHGERGQW